MMKSMKTIIRLLTVTLTTTVSLSTVLACETTTLQDVVDDIVSALTSGVQGNSLTSSSTQKNALDLFQTTALYINKEAIVTLAIPLDASKKLEEGDSFIKVIVTLKTITTPIFEAIIIGVR